MCLSVIIFPQLEDGLNLSVSSRGESEGNNSSIVYYNLDSDCSSLRESQGGLFMSQLKLKEIASKLNSTTQVGQTYCNVYSYVKY